MIINGVKIKQRAIGVLDTERCQVLLPGDQVVYVQPVTHEYSEGYSLGFTHREVTLRIHGGKLKVARILVIEEEYPGWADADGKYVLHLDNGESVDSRDAVRTDGACK